MRRANKKHHLSSLNIEKLLIRPPLQKHVFKITNRRGFVTSLSRHKAANNLLFTKDIRYDKSKDQIEHEAL